MKLLLNNQEIRAELQALRKDLAGIKRLHPNDYPAVLAHAIERLSFYIEESYGLRPQLSDRGLPYGGTEE